MTTGGYSSIVKAVGIKVLKAKLSQYVRLAKAGETILVTERDEVVAELRPARRQPTGSRPLEEALEALADRGEATLATEGPAGWKGFAKKIHAKDFSSEKLLDALRRESR